MRGFGTDPQLHSAAIASCTTGGQPSGWPQRMDGLQSFAGGRV